MVFDELYPSIKPSVALVVTPLIAIMQDQPDQVTCIHLYVTVFAKTSLVRTIN